MSLQLLLENGGAEVLTAAKPAFYGWLTKRNVNGKMQERYCIIVHGFFFYYLDATSKRPRGGFTLAGYRIAQVINAGMGILEAAYNGVPPKRTCQMKDDILNFFQKSVTESELHFAPEFEKRRSRNAFPVLHDPKYKWAFVIESEFSHQREYYFASNSYEDQTQWIFHTNNEAKQVYPDVKTKCVDDWISFAAKSQYEVTRPKSRTQSAENETQISTSATNLPTNNHNTEMLLAREKFRTLSVEQENQHSKPVKESPNISEDDYLKLIPDVNIYNEMERCEAEKLLTNDGRPGIFLIRHNEKYVLSVYTGNTCKHYIIFRKDNFRFLHDYPEPKFYDLSDLLNYYSKNKLPTCETILSHYCMKDSYVANQGNVASS